MEDNEQDENRSIKSTDKLNYRTEIQSKISGYLNAIGTFDLEKAVSALRNSVFFEIPGLPFKTEILKKEKQLDFERDVRIVYIIKKNRNEWLHPYKRLIHQTAISESYNMDLGEFLLELIAQHDGLVGVKGFVETGGTEID